MDRTVFLYDGDCAFCSSCARFIKRWIRAGFPVTAWQFADLPELGVTEEQVSEAVSLVRPEHAPTFGPVAIAALLRAAHGPLGWLLWRPAGLVLSLPPVRASAWPVYRWVARNRHRMPGGTAACALPPNHPARGGR